MRMGQVSKRADDLFKERLIKEINHSELIRDNSSVVNATRDACNKINIACLGLLEGPDYKYMSRDTDIYGNALTEEQQLKWVQIKERFPKVVTLRKNALVMMTRNLNTAAGQVNGRLAIVRACHPDCVILRSLDGTEEWPVPYLKQTIDGYRFIRRQVPVILAYGITIHKVQGMTLDNVIVNIDDTIFESGQAYVALTRTKSLDQLRLLNFDKKRVFLAPYFKDLLRWMENNDFFNENRNPNIEFPHWEPRAPPPPRKTRKVDNTNVPIYEEDELSDIDCDCFDPEPDVQSKKPPMRLPQRPPQRPPQKPPKYQPIPSTSGKNPFEIAKKYFIEQNEDCN